MAPGIYEDHFLIFYSVKGGKILALTSNYHSISSFLRLHFDKSKYIMEYEHKRRKPHFSSRTTRGSHLPCGTEWACTLAWPHSVQIVRKASSVATLPLGSFSFSSNLGHWNCPRFQYDTSCRIEMDYPWTFRSTSHVRSRPLGFSISLLAHMYMPCVKPVGPLEILHVSQTSF